MPYPVPPPEPAVVPELPPTTVVAIAPDRLANRTGSAADLIAPAPPDTFVEYGQIATNSPLVVELDDEIASSMATEPQDHQPLPGSVIEDDTTAALQAQVPAIAPDPSAVPIPVAPPETQVVPERTQMEPSVPAESTPAETFVLRNVQVMGSTVLTDAELRPILDPLIERPITLVQLQAAVDAITQLYLNRGYITSRALDAAIAGDTAQIQIVEGGLEQIEIDGLERVNANYVRDRLQRAAGTPLNTINLENQLRLLRQNPLFENVEASLRAGEQFGQSVLMVRVNEADPFSGTVSIANDSPPSVGSERANLDLVYRNLTGNGDALNGYYRRSFTGGSETYGLAYTVPVNPADGTIQLQIERNRNEITQDPFDELGIRGSNTRYEVTYRQPIVRSPQEEFALSVGFTYQDGQTFVFNDIPFPFGAGVEADGESRTSVFRFAQDYVHRDSQGAWSLRSQFNIGTGLFDATGNEEDVPDGQFVSWLGQAQRVQRLSEDHLLIIQADLQLTPDGLLPSQQLAIGGIQSVRGYRQNVRSGDNGFRLSVEDRITIQRDGSGNPTLQVAPFLDMGAVWNNANNPLPDDNFLMGVGLGVVWTPTPQVSLRVDYGVPIVTLGDRGNNAQDDGLYFRVSYQL